MAFSVILFLVEIPGLEPGLREPESLVLPLHHISVSLLSGGKVIKKSINTRNIFDIKFWGYLSLMCIFVKTQYLTVN